MRSMIKRVVFATVALLMVFSVFALTSCGHEHTFRKAWSANKTHHWHEATCEHENEVADKEEHVWVEKEVTKEGVIVFECECGVIKKHSHDYAAEWSFDETNHWHAATCEHADQVNGQAAHRWGAGATEGDTVTYACADCDATKRHTHTYAETYEYDAAYHWYAATCEHAELIKSKAAHRWDEGTTEGDTVTYACTDCEATKQHTHTYAEAYEYDATRHWHAATCAHSGLRKGEQEHALGEPTVNTDGETVRRCVCGYESIEAHTHEIATDWTYDETHHWHEASCGRENHRMEYGAHNWGAGVENGDTITYTCLCGATKSHTHAYDNAWTYDETNHWHAATCEHTEKVSGLAAHVFDEGTETVGGTVYACACGYSHLVEAVSVEYVFEAEHTNVQGVQGAGYSGGTDGVGLIGKDYVGTAMASNDCYIAGLNLNGTALTFKIVSDKDVSDANLVIRLSAEFQDIVFTDEEWLVQVNGVKVSYGSISITDVITDVSSEEKLAFEDFGFGKISLKKGENVITLKTNNSKPMVGTMYSTAPMVDCLKITSTATLTMEKYNEDFLSRL